MSQDISRNIKRNFLLAVARYELAIDAANSFTELRAIEANLEGLRQASVSLGMAEDAVARCVLAKSKAQIKVGEELGRLGMGSGRWRTSADASFGRLPEGISHTQSSRYQLLAKFGWQRINELLAQVGPEGFSSSEIIRRAKALFVRERRDDQADAIRREPPPLPGSTFRVIAADVPWPYGNDYDPDSRRGASQYPEMSIEQITAMAPQVEALAATPDAILWFWTTHEFLPYSFAIVDAWGFDYKTTLTWVKPHMGLGVWLRSRSEYCLFAIRGHPLVTLSNQTTVLEAPNQPHSQKPDEFYALVEALCPAPGYLELFARRQRANWTVWGDQAPVPEAAE